MNERAEQRNRISERLSEREIEDWENYLSDIEGQLNTYYQDEYLEQLEEVMHALKNIDSDGNIIWVSEERMIEISGEYMIEECFSNNAAIIMECDNYKKNKVWFICLIRR